MNEYNIKYCCLFLFLDYLIVSLAYYDRATFDSYCEIGFVARGRYNGQGRRAPGHPNKKYHGEGIFRPKKK